MTQRERQPSGGVFTAPPKVSGGTERLSSSLPEFGFPSWDQVFCSASPAAQAEWLALARRQGVLYAHQFPTLSNGSTAGADQGRKRVGIFIAAVVIRYVVKALERRVKERCRRLRLSSRRNEASRDNADDCDKIPDTVYRTRLCPRWEGSFLN